MRTLQVAFITLICTCLLAGCSKEVMWDNDMSNGPELKSRNLIDPPLFTGLDQERIVTMSGIDLKVTLPDNRERSGGYGFHCRLDQSSDGLYTNNSIISGIRQGVFILISRVMD